MMKSRETRPSRDTRKEGDGGNLQARDGKRKREVTPVPGTDKTLLTAADLIAKQGLPDVFGTPGYRGGDASSSSAAALEREKQAIKKILGENTYKTADNVSFVLEAIKNTKILKSDKSLYISIKKVTAFLNTEETKQLISYNEMEDAVNRLREGLPKIQANLKTFVAEEIQTGSARAINTFLANLGSSDMDNQGPSLDPHNKAQERAVTETKTPVAGPSQQGDSRLGRSSDAASAGDRGKERQASQDAGDNINQKFLEKITWKYMDSVRIPLDGAALQAHKPDHRLNPQIGTIERLRVLRKILIVTRGLKSNERSSNSISVHTEDLVDRKIDFDKDP